MTHNKRLKDVGEEMEWFLKGTAALGNKLGTLLVQLPPYLREDTNRLESFLKQYSAHAPLALEFRHTSWFSETTLQMLKEYQAALVLSETDENSPAKTVTAPFIYIRLRKSDYSETDLKQWAQWLREQKKDAFVYLKHENNAPELARRLVQALATG